MGRLDCRPPQKGLAQARICRVKGPGRVTLVRAVGVDRAPSAAFGAVAAPAGRAA